LRVYNIFARFIDKSDLAIFPISNSDVSKFFGEKTNPIELGRDDNISRFIYKTIFITSFYTSETFRKITDILELWFDDNMT